jgi:hypothetical protein
VRNCLWHFGRTYRSEVLIICSVTCPSRQVKHQKNLFLQEVFLWVEDSFDFIFPVELLIQSLTKKALRAPRNAEWPLIYHLLWGQNLVWKPGAEAVRERSADG